MLEKFKNPQIRNKNVIYNVSTEYFNFVQYEH